MTLGDHRLSPASQRRVQLLKELLPNPDEPQRKATRTQRLALSRLRMSTGKLI